ncbi:MAG: hypothetical protein JWP25_374 [Bradyrhizobium sp.]|nr:hypothetical protein [Bradyrhizobium sp.]
MRNVALYVALFQVACWLVAVAAWVTHVVTCIKAGSIGFLILGAFIFPVGVIHGWCIWLGIV